MNDRATPPPDELREALERIEAMGSDVAYQYTRAAAMSEVAREALRAATPAPEPDICGTCDGIGCPVCRPIPEPEYQPDSLGFEHPHTPEETFEVQEANGSRVVSGPEDVPPVVAAMRQDAARRNVASPARPIPGPEPEETR